MEHHGVAVPQYINQNGIEAFYQELPKYLKEVYKSSDWTYYDLKDGKTNLPYEIYTLTGAETTYYPCDTQGFKMDIIGREIAFDDPPCTGCNGPRICVDVNGRKKPNTMGIDIFNFLFTTDGFVIPEGQEYKDSNYDAPPTYRGTIIASPTYCQSNDTPFSQTACGYYALLDKNPQGNGRYWKDFIGRKLYK